MIELLTSPTEDFAVPARQVRSLVDAAGAGMVGSLAKQCQLSAATPHAAPT